MDEEPTSAADAGPASATGEETDPPVGTTTPDGELTPPVGPAAGADAAIRSLPWDDDLPLALGDEPDAAASPHDGGVAGHPEGEDELDGSRSSARVAADGDDGTAEGAYDDGYYDGDYPGDDLGDLSEDPVGGRRNALPRRVETWRSRSATGAIATAIAMGLQQVFEPEKRRPAIVAEAPSDPYSDDDAVTVDYVPDDAEGTKVHVKPWLMEKGDPS